MDPVSPSLSPDQAWTALPASAWDAAAARHLLRRAGFAAIPEQVDALARQPLDQVVAQLFERPPPLSPPLALTELAEDIRELDRDRRMTDEAARRRARQQFQERARQAYEEFAIRWLQRAADPRHAAYEKFVLFLQDIFVVAFQKVKNPVLLFDHQQLLRDHGTGPYDALCKRVSRSPAMIVYLDLQQSRLEHPNENFARELFELFTLGEGNYTERDIQEAARAFTGYRQRAGTFIFAPRQHDRGRKTVFGASGEFDGDGVIDQVFKQPAAARFLPRELVRYYLTDQPLPDGHLEALGELWRRDGFSTGRLLQRFFTSRLFFDPAHRGALIKSPVQHYLGLVQELGLQVAPFPRMVLGALRQAGQAFFNPPNVRGWVGGRAWINSTTLAARRQLVDWVCSPLDEGRLNGDELVEYVAARAEGAARFTLDDAVIGRWRALGASAAARELVERSFGAPPAAALLGEITTALAEALAHPTASDERTRAVVAGLLNSPHCQLC